MSLTEIHPQQNPIAKLRSFLPEDDRRVQAIVEPLRARHVGSDRDDVVFEGIKRLHRNACKRRFPKLPDGPNNRTNGVGFAVISESGAGKSTIMERVIALLILEKLGYVPERDLRENVAWKRARAMLKRAGVFFIWFDEVGNVLHQKGAHEIRKVADTFRALMLQRDWPIQVIMSGVSEVEDLLAIDRQLRRRVKCISFPAVELPRDADLVDATISDYASAAKLPVRFAPADDIVPRVCHAAVHQFGLMIEIIIDAIEACLLDRHEVLTIRDFANAYTGRTMQPIEQNPFLAADWRAVDCSVIRKRLVEDENAPPRRRKGRRR